MDLKKLINENNIILDEVFLSKFDTERPFILFADGKTDDETIFCAVSHDNENEMYFYKYSKPFEEIEQKHKEDILTYTLGKHGSWENIYASDIFLHGKYVFEIKNPFKQIFQ